MVIRFRKHIPLLLTLVFVLISGLRIMAAGVEPIYDQSKLMSHEISQGSYPPFESGVSSALFVALYKLVGSTDPVTASAHVRALAMVLYLASGYLLFTSLQKDGIVLATLCVLLLFTSRFPFLWLSSELLAGAFLMLLLWSIQRRLPLTIIAVFVSLFMFSKPDLVFSGIVVGLFIALFPVREPTLERRIAGCAILVVAVALPLLPGILQHGIEYLAPQGRSAFSFGQHYAAMVAKHQIVADAPDPWLSWQSYLTPVWGPAESLIGTIVSHPSEYLDFLFLSAAHSLKSFVRTNLIFILPVSIYALLRARPTKARTTSALLLLGFLPITLLAFTHARYIARFYPLFLFMACLYLAESPKRRERLLLWSCLVVVLVLQLFQVPAVMAAGYWFPD